MSPVALLPIDIMENLLQQNRNHNYGHKTNGFQGNENQNSQPVHNGTNGIAKLQHLPGNGYCERLATAGGTFDTLHAGHKEYVQLAFEYADRVRLYVTSDNYARSKKCYPVKSYAVRIKRLTEFIHAIGVKDDRYQIRPLNSQIEVEADLFNDDIDLAIVVPEYYALLRGINKKRLAVGKKRIMILVKERTRDRNNNDISSSEIHSRENGACKFATKSVIPNVFTWGTFDCLHDGHKQFLMRVAQLGRLYVIVIPSRMKFESCGYYPINSANKRKRDLLRFGHVENKGLIEDVFIDCFTYGLKSMLKIRPDIFCFGYDQYLKWDKELIRLLQTKKFNATLIRILTENGNGIHSSRRNDRFEIFSDTVEKINIRDFQLV